MSKLSAFLLILALAISAFAPANVVASSGMNAPANSSEPVCGSTTTVNLLRNSDKKLDSGDVTVANGETTLFVTYTTASPWTLVKTDLAVASSLAGIPVTSKGNPKVDQFPYHGSHAGVTTYTYEIPLSGLGNIIYIAARADLKKTGSTKIEGAWADGTPFTPGKRSWGMYFMYTVQPCNEPPVAVDDNYSTDEDTPLNVGLPGVLTNDSDPDGDPITAELVTSTTHGTLNLNTDGSFDYSPDANYNGPDSFTYQAKDSFGNLSNTATVSITVNPVDDLPVAGDDAFEVLEDSNATSFDVLANDSDADGDPFTIGSVTQPANGVVVNNGTDLTYQPNAGYCNDGSPTDDFTYTLNPGGDSATVAVTVNCVDDEPVASDDTATVTEDSSANAIDVLANDVDPDGGPKSVFSVTQPANGSVVITGGGTGLTYQPNVNYCNNGSPTDTFTYQLNSGTGPTATVFVTVTCVDDAPAAVNDTATVDEDSSATPIAVLVNDTDVDGGPMSIISVTQPTNGSVAITGGGTGLTYQPNADACNDGSPTDDFTYTLDPGGSTATVSVTVTCINDAPSFDLPASPNQTVVQDSGPQTVSGFATNISAGPANESGQTVTFNVTNDNNALFSSQPDIDETTGDLTYTPAGGATGSATVSVYLTDDGGTANGGVDTSATQIFTITISPPNAVPVAAGQTVSTNEDTLKTITLSATDDDGDGLTFSIVGNPSNGSLGSIGSVTCVGSPSTCTADVNYTPAANFNGPDSFTFKANDGTQDSNTATVDITVDAVNDAPSFTSGGNVTVDEDSGAYSAAWATGISAGPTDESGQILSFSVQSNNNPTLFSVVPSIASDGTLSFTLAANAFGTATLNVVLQDNGGGTDTSAPVNFDIIVTGVNDAPSFTKGADQTVDEDAGVQTVNGWATGISAGPNESSQTVTFIIDSNDNPSLFSAGPSVASNGTLTYTPAANQNGVANITLHIEDDGGTANGGVDSSATQSFVITVNAVNDAPVALTKTGSAHTNMKIVGVNPGLLTGVTDADTGINGCNPTFTVASITSNTGGTVSNVNLAAGTFDFDPTPGFTGTAVVNYTVQDNGCPGTATSAPTAINITVSGPVIWFVNPAAGVNGNGGLSSPFNNLASAAAVDASGHRIFVYTGTATSGISLNSDEWLIGQGVTGTTFDALFSITPPIGTIARPSINGTRPVIQGNVAMATSDAVRGLNIQPASGTAGLTASGATSLTVGEVSVTTANAAAVNLSSSGGTISLTSVSANGGSNGILLNSTTGTFTVAGTGGTCTEANTSGCSGGVIQNMTGGDDSSATPIGTGIVLNNAAGVSLTRMYIHDHSNYGIRGTSVNGFTLANSVVSGVNGTNVASPYSDGSISFDNLSGTSSIANSFISGGYQRNIRVDNTTGALTLTINANSIHNTSNAAGDDGILLEVGGGTATLNVTNNTFAAHGGDHLNVSLLGSPTVSLTFTGNFWTGGHPIGLGQGLFILAASFNSPGTFTYNISNNGTVANPLVGNNSGGAMHVNKGSGTGSFSGTISNNVIGDPAVNSSGSLNASGIDVEAHGSGGSHTTLISNNLVRQFHNDGILVLAGEGSATLNATVTGNTVTNPDNTIASFHGMHFNIGTLPTDNMLACLHVASNSLTTAGNEANGGVDLRMRQRQLTTVRLPGYGGANNDNAAVQTFLTGTNLNSVTTILASNTVATGGGFVGGAACPLP